MKYSFIVPIYNVEAYLSKCIDSLLSQTYKDFEIILVDDGSTDSSGMIADDYFQKNTKIITVVHQVNAGPGEARNKGISLSRGEYLLMVDGDDYVSERILEIIDSYLVKYNNDILCFDYIVENPNGSQRAQRLYDIVSYMPITPKQYILGAPSPCNKVFRRWLFEETKICFPSHIHYGEDLATIFCLALHAVNIGVIENALYYYVQRETSTMHSIFFQNNKGIIEICTAVKILLDYYKDQGKFEEYYQELEYLTVRHVLTATAEKILNVKYDYQQIENLTQFVEMHFPNYRSNNYLQKYIKEPGHRKERWIIEKKYGILFLEYFLKDKIRKIVKVFQ